MKTSQLTLLAVAVFAAFALAQVTGAEPQRNPKMRAALAQLKIARDILKDAEADKGGHRRRAMELMDLAAKEIEKGIEFAAENK